MFRSFKNKANSVLEESFLMITDTHLIELRSSKLNLSTGIGKWKEHSLANSFRLNM